MSCSSAQQTFSLQKTLNVYIRMASAKQNWPEIERQRATAKLDSCFKVDMSTFAHAYLCRKGQHSLFLSQRTACLRSRPVVTVTPAQRVLLVNYCFSPKPGYCFACFVTKLGLPGYRCMAQLESLAFAFTLSAVVAAAMPNYAVAAINSGEAAKRSSHRLSV